MAGAQVCRVCRALLTSNDEARSPGVCPYCGAATDSDLDTSNPYAPPRAEPGTTWPGKEAVEGIPPTLPGKLGFAFKLLFGNFPLISAVVLTVWFPGHLLIGLVTYGRPEQVDNSLNVVGLLTNLIEVVFGPIPAGGIVYILANRMTGRSSSYIEAIQVGFHNWWRLFAARLITAAIIVAGAFAFLVPGVIFAIRYSLLDPVVVLEGAGILESRHRSTALVRGKEREIFTGGALYFIVFVGIGIGLNVISKLYPALNTIWSNLILNCTINVFSVFISCFLFSYFWEAHVRNPANFGTGGKQSEFNDEF